MGGKVFGLIMFPRVRGWRGGGEDIFLRHAGEKGTRRETENPGWNSNNKQKREGGGEERLQRMGGMGSL